MSLPQFQTGTSITREEAINQIISSIAMEELGLSHIINAEGEKLQYVLGTIPGVTGPTATIDDVLKVNESVRMVLQGAAESQSLLRSKLQNALSSAVLTGPTGPTGGTGATGPGLILPLSSGSTPLTIDAGADGDPFHPGIVGIGAGYTQATLTANDEIDLSGSPQTAAQFSFLVPREGAITDLAARFYMTQPLELTGTTGTVTAHLYQSKTPGSDVFAMIAEVTLEPELGPVGSPHPIGTVLSVTAHDLKAQATTGARLLLAFEVQGEGEKPDIKLSGYANASIDIS